MVSTPRRIKIDIKEKSVELSTIKRMGYDGKEDVTSNVKVYYAPMERMVKDGDEEILQKTPALIISVWDGDSLIVEYTGDELK